MSRSFLEVSLDELVEYINEDKSGFYNHYLHTLNTYSDRFIPLTLKIKELGFENISIIDFIELANLIDTKGLYHEKCLECDCQLSWENQDYDGKCSSCKVVEERRMNY